MSHIFYIVLPAILFFSSCSQTPKDMNANKDVILSTIHSRKSVRDFVEGKEISKGVLDTLVRAAMAAPTAVNLQPWHFIVVTERAKLDSLSVGLLYAKMLPKAAAAIIVCGDSTIKAGNMAFWEFDCSLASANILLTVEAMGLGAVWTAVHPDQKRIDFVRQQLQIPEHIIPLNLIPIGHPTGKDKPKDKFKAEKIHYNIW